ncbi:MAG: hypothetical protein U5L72_02485 [Bacteroidales bacterium]|nr:hypothetical protein [Bacteroidales bacterium]
MRAIPDREGGLSLDLGPAESVLFVFDREKVSGEWNPLPTTGSDTRVITEGWKAEFRHCRDGSVKEVAIDRLEDLKEMPDFVHFSGSVTYRNTIWSEDNEGIALNLGKVYGTSEAQGERKRLRCAMVRPQDLGHLGIT